MEGVFWFVFGVGVGIGVLPHLQRIADRVRRRLAELDVHDLSITTPEIEDIFLRFYDRDAPMGMDDTAAEAEEMAR